MNRFKKLLIVPIAMILMLSTIIPAANGSLTFSHGTRQKYLRGGISSTAKESSLGVIMDIYRSNGQELTAGSRVGCYNEKSYLMTYYEKGYAGNFSCTYYCGGSKVGTSSAPWDYDFR